MFHKTQLSNVPTAMALCFFLFGSANVTAQLAPGSIVGVLDFIGEDELLIGGRPQMWACGGPLNECSFHQGIAVGGAFVLDDLTPSATDGYRVNGDLMIRGGDRFEFFRTPYLDGAVGSPNAQILVGEAETVNLTDTFVMVPGFVGGDVLLTGHSCLAGLYRDGDANGDGIPDQAASFTHAHAFGASALAPGATHTANGAFARTVLAGSYDAASTSFTGDYELVLGGLAGEDGVWGVSLFLDFKDTATPGDPTSYQDSRFEIRDNDAHLRVVEAGTTQEQPFRQCLSQLTLSFESLTERIYQPSLFMNGTLQDLDFEGREVDYRFEGRADGTPTSLATAAHQSQVTLCLPQGTYSFQPTLSLVAADGGVRQETLAWIEDIELGCGESLEVAAAPISFSASDHSGSDEFANASAVDGSTMVVGAYRDDEMDAGAGAVYVYDKDAAGNWAEAAKITAFDFAFDDKFGVSVALSGGVLVVGSYLDDESDQDSGSIYIYGRDVGGTGNWGLIRKVANPAPESKDYFGHSVALDGSTLIVGAYRDDNTKTDSGSAYVFERDAGGTDNWGEVKHLVASDEGNYDKFGYAVALDGDTLIVGAFANNDDGGDSGSAYVFERDVGGAGNWGETKKLNATDGDSDFRFGISVAIDGGTLVVGGDEEGEGSGSAYVFERDLGGAGNWGEVAKLTASDAAADDLFGTSVAIAGSAVIVGAPEHDGAAGADSGAIYLYEKDAAGAWNETAAITAPDGAAGDLFGTSLSTDGTTWVIGATYADSPTEADVGRVYTLE
jgi:hypothetical protein